MPAYPWPAVAGLCAALLAAAVGLLVASWPRRPTVDDWLRRRGQRRIGSAHSNRGEPGNRWRWAISRLAAGVNRRLPTSLQAALSGLLARAGVGTTPAMLVTRGLLAMVAVGCAGFVLAAEGILPLSVVILGVLAVPAAVGAQVVQMAGRRRRAIVDQLPILVDLMALEQGGGGVGPRVAMEFVVDRLEGEAAQLLRNCLTASATAGTPQLDRQLEMAGVQLDIPALSALAAVVRIQREEGVSTSSPLGQLARGLRDRQRDELLARGRKALITMLFPVALCILLPFILIILYPALSRLTTAFS
jgi:Flp pilus assembly protein TadB